MKTGLILIVLCLLFVVTAYAAPTTISFQNISAAGQTNFAATCNIVGVYDNVDLVNNTTDRINLTSLRTVSLTKGGLANYSTSLHPNNRSFRVTCVKTTTGDNYQQVKMYFDRVTTFWMHAVNGVFKFN